jgi:hypothetical protein
LKFEEKFEEEISMKKSYKKVSLFSHIQNGFLQKTKKKKRIKIHKKQTKKKKKKSTFR